jgi:hypothetical protein
VALCWFAGAVGAVAAPASPARFTPLVPLPAPRIIDSAAAHPGSYGVERIVDGLPATEYSSNGKGIDTFITFDFGKPVKIAAFYHLDRRDPATVAESRLTLGDTPDLANPQGTTTVRHANTRSGVTFCPLAAPVTARYVKWQVTALGPQKYGTVGGAEIRFYTAVESDPAPIKDSFELVSRPAVVLQDGKPVRTVLVKIEHPYAEPADAMVEVSGLPPQAVRLSFGTQTVEVALPAAEREATRSVAIHWGGKPMVERQMVLKPVRHWTIHLHSHSHVDIGYTNVQTEIEKLHWKYTDEALDILERTADYPPGAQFKWNSEVLWAIDSYLKQATPEKRERFARAVKSGRLHLDAMYGNELTGLCRPEELFRLFDCARRLSREFGVTIDAAMISDVPGWTWGIVPALAQSGVKYFSCGTNHIHRIGNTIEAWGDRPFYWVSPSGQEKVLCWVHGKGYSWFHLHGRFEKVAPQTVFDYLAQLESSGFPYDMLPIRYSIDGDNGPPDPRLPDLVKAWNEKYVWPKIVIATTGETFREFERRFGDKLPEARGDFTPYWEDGAGSSARETAQVRNAANQLVQAETLFALVRPAQYPKEGFYQAWRNVLLYNEHTWGAHCSISQPDSDFTKAQWKIKEGFAAGTRQSEQLVAKAFEGYGASGQAPAAFDVFNTTSWTRTGLAVIPATALANGPATLKDAEGRPLPSQRTRDGSLHFVVRDVPPLGAKRVFVESGGAPAAGNAKVEGLALTNGRVRVVIDDQTGAIASLTREGIPIDLVDRASGMGLNEYLYVAGRDPKAPRRSAKPRITVQESGPLVASLVIESEAPGCRRLTREVAVTDASDTVSICDTLDRLPVRTPDAVHFGFPVNVPRGVMRLDVPWAMIRPEVDQLPGACKNYLSVGRWVDISNDRFGLTWSTADAPLVEVGAIRMDVSSPFDPKAWVKRLEPTQTFYSYAMNNYWETNYKADQEGVTRFRYRLTPHGPFDRAEAMREGIARDTPLLPVAVAPDAPRVESLLRVDPAEVLVTSLKPSDDGKALVVRLWNAGEKPAKAVLAWNAIRPRRVSRSSPFEDDRGELTGPIELPPLGMVTVRAETR